MKESLLLLLLLAVVPSCSILEKGEKLIDDGRALIGDLKKEGERVKSELKVAAAQADTNQDGKTTIPEWALWLTTGGGAAFIMALIRNGKSNERKARTDAKVDAQEERLRKLESFASAPGTSRVPGV